jgi:hypothetical protein
VSSHGHNHIFFCYTYSGVGTKVEEDLSNSIEDNEESGGSVEDGLVSETKDDKHDGKHNEAHDLNKFAAQAINSKNGDPISRNGAKQLDDQVTNTGSEHRSGKGIELA